MKKVKEDVDRRQQGGGRLGKQREFSLRGSEALFFRPACILRRCSAEKATHLRLWKYDGGATYVKHVLSERMRILWLLFHMSFKNLNFIFQSTLVTILRYSDTFLTFTPRLLAVYQPLC